MSNNLPEIRKGEPLDQVVIRAEHETLDLVEMTNRTLHLMPPVELKVGDLYCIQVWEDHLRLWHCIVDEEFKATEPT